jgi:hypothetical protein
MGRLGWALALVFHGVTLGADERFLVVESKPEGRVELVQADSGESILIGSGILRPRAAVLETGGDLLVAGRSEIRRYRGALEGLASEGIVVTTELRNIRALTLERMSGDLYVVARPRHGSGLGAFRLPRDPGAPGGFGAPEAFGSSFPSLEVDDVEFSKEGSFEGGVLLLLSRRPRALWRVAGHGSEVERLTDNFPQDAHPVDIAWSLGDGQRQILVADRRGVIHRFDDSGGWLPPFNGGRTHRGLTQIAVSLAEGVPVVYAARERGEVLRFQIGSDGVAVDPEGEPVSRVFRKPVGLGAVFAAPTPTGTMVTVNPGLGLDVRFDEVVEGGFTAATLRFVMDRREHSRSESSGDLVLESGNRVPAGVAPPLGGDLRFPLFRIATNVQFSGTFRLLGREEPLFGHRDPERFHEASSGASSEWVRWMFAPELAKGEPPVAGCDAWGCAFTDITTGFGSHIGRGWDFSEYLMARDQRGGYESEPGKPDTRWSPQPSELSRIAIKLDFLRETLDAHQDGLGPGLRRRLHHLLGRLLRAYQRALERDRPDDANQILDRFIQVIENAKLPSSPPGNLSGELIARARSLKLSTCSFLEFTREGLNACAGEEK